MTETAMLHDSAATRLKLQQLKEAGIGISVDDFGTGYSSLSYLQRFPVSTLKIARDFVELDRDDHDAWQFASAIIAMANALRLSVIAEGVERPAQLRRLTRARLRLRAGLLLREPAGRRRGDIAAGPRPLVQQVREAGRPEDPGTAPRRPRDHADGSAPSSGRRPPADGARPIASRLEAGNVVPARTKQDFRPMGRRRG